MSQNIILSSYPWHTAAIHFVLKRSFRLIPDHARRGYMFGYRLYRDDNVGKNYKLCYVSDASHYLWLCYSLIGIGSTTITTATAYRLATYKQDFLTLLQSFDPDHPLVMTMGICCCSMLFFIVTNLYRQRIIARLYYSENENKFCAVMHNLFLQKRTLTFTADDVRLSIKKLDISNSFATHVIAGKTYILSDDGFTDVKYLNILMSNISETAER